MDDLKKMFADMFFSDAKTILQTGNIVISTNRNDLSVLKAEIEEHLNAAFQYDTAVFIRASEQLVSAISAAGMISTPTDCHLYYLICDDKSIISELGSIFKTLPHRQGEAFIPHADGAFWTVPVGETLESPFGKKALGDKRFKSVLTSRNMNTIQKITAVMLGPQG